MMPIRSPSRLFGSTYHKSYSDSSRCGRHWRPLVVENLETRTLLSICLSNLAVTSPIYENGFAHLAGNIIDPNTSSAMPMTIDWGDGLAVETVELSAGTTSFEIAHQYLDNLPGDAPYTITATLSDEASEGAWSVVAPILQSSFVSGGVAAPQIDGVWYVVGDNGGSTFQAYDSATDTWSMKTPVPLRQNDSAGGVIDGKLYLAAGCLGNDWGSPTNKLLIYDPATDSWAEGPAAPTARCKVTGAAIGEKLYVMGGVNWTWSGLVNYNTLEIYDAANHSWSTGAPMPIASEGSRAEVVDGKIYVVGGLVRDPPPGYTGHRTDMLAVYDPVTNTWTTAAPMPTPREGMATGVLDGKLYVAGGCSSSGTTDVVEVYDPATDTWATAPSLATARWLASGVAMNGKLYVAGGTTNPIYTPVASAEVFTPASPSPPSSVSLVVENVAPENLDLILSTATIDENGTTVLSGSFSDPGTLDTHTVTIEWGDDTTPTTLDLAAGVLNFAPSAHQYLDNAAGDMPYTITVTITDNDGASDMAATAIAVTNIAPTISAIVSSSPGVGGAHEGTPVTVSVDLADVGTLDTHTALIDWGDGTTSAAAINESDGSGTAYGSHSYAAGGIYTINVALTDDDSGVATATTSAVVAGAGIHDRVLQIIGTNGADGVLVSKFGHTLLVYANFLPNFGLRTFDAKNIDRMVVLLGNGVDYALLSDNVKIDALIDGGDGDDQLNGGGGNNILLGGAGNDWLTAGYGRDILIGGTGRDWLIGRNQDDILIAGTTSLDLNDAAMNTNFDHALLAVLTEWNSTGSYQSRVTRLRPMFDAFDDDARDTLVGSQGRDWFFANLTGGVRDLITDLRGNEAVEEL